jgi:hypothetical protein
MVVGGAKTSQVVPVVVTCGGSQIVVVGSTTLVISCVIPGEPSVRGGGGKIGGPATDVHVRGPITLPIPTDIGGGATAFVVPTIGSDDTVGSHREILGTYGLQYDLTYQMLQPTDRRMADTAKGPRVVTLLGIID